jgi:hypothetical protein
VKRGYLEQIIAAAVAEAVKPLVDGHMAMHARLAEISDEMAAQAEKLQARAAKPYRSARIQPELLEMLDGVTVAWLQ